MNEHEQNGFGVHSADPKVHCKVFEDNGGAIKVAKVPKAGPRTKHLNVKPRHFRDHLEQGEITIRPILTNN
jgi:hypothetical protein